jgi:hypothetical protein
MKEINLSGIKVNPCPATTEEMFDGSTASNLSPG